MKKDNYPFVSILLPARNESAVILETLKCLNNLNYPKDHLEILVANDGSDDDTEEIILRFIHNQPHFKLISISGGQKKIPGKAGVLSILANQAQGAFLLMTDADTHLPRYWIENMLTHFEPHIGIITGFTIVKPTSFFACMQSLDWLVGMGCIQILSRFNIPVTSVGNNMAVRTEAYRHTGGYEKIPFSVTEDFALFREIINLGYQFRHLKNENSFAFTRSETTCANLIRQRLRWACGAVQIPKFCVLFLFAYMLCAILLPLLYCFNQHLAIWFWAAKCLVQYSIAIYFIVQFKQYILLKWIPVYEVYSLGFNFVLLLKYLMTNQIIWKGKAYPKK